MSKNKMIMLPREVVEQALEALLNEGEFRKLLKPLIEKSIDSIRDALEQPDAGPPVTAPEGWKLVPVEPTDEMVEAGDHEIEKWGVDASSSGAFRAMLAAAPHPQSDPTPYLYYDPENGDTWTQDAVDEGFCVTDNLIPLYTK